MMIIYRAKDHEEEEEYYSKSKTELIIDAAGNTVKATGRFAGKVFKIIIWTSITILVVGGIAGGVVYYKLKDEHQFHLDLYNAFNNMDYSNSKHRNRIDEFMNSIKTNKQIDCLKAKERIIQLERDEFFLCKRKDFGVFRKFRECIDNARNDSIYQNNLKDLKSSNQGLGKIIEEWYDKYIKPTIKTP